MADDAGALLVRTGLISDQALVSARASMSQHGGTIGEQLVLGGAVSDDALTEFFRSRLLVPKVNPNTLARLPGQVVEAIPGDMAIEFRCVPVALDREGNLTIAMSDPSDRHAVDEIGFFTGKYVVRAVATQMQIAWCLAHYYGHITELGQRLLRPSDGSAAPPSQPAPAPAAPSAPLPRARGFTGRVDAARHKVLPPVAAPEINVPRPSDKLLTPSREDLQRIAAAREGAVAAARAAVEAEGAQQNTGPIETPAPAGDTGPIAVAAAAAAVSDGAPAAEVPPAISEPYEAVQVHVSLMAGDEKTPPRGVVQRPQRKIVPDPPELAARSGEMEAHDATRRSDLDALPAVLVAIEPEEEPVVAAPAPAPPRAPAMIVDDDDEDEDEDDAPEVDGDALQPIDDAEDDDAAVIHDLASPRDEAAPLTDHSGTESRPILLVAKPRVARDTVDDVDDDDDEPVVLLDKKRTETPSTSAAAVATAGSIADAVDEAVRAAAQRRRPERRTQIGVGLPEVAPRPSRPATGDETAAATAAMKAAAAAAIASPPPEAVPMHVTPALTVPGTTAAAAASALLNSAANAVRRKLDAPSGAVTAPVAAPPVAAAPLKRAASEPNIRTPADGIPSMIDDGQSDASTRPHYNPPTMEEIDEGWGRPGTTIPPPFLGAMPGTESGPVFDSASIPISSDADDQPALLVAAPAPPTSAPTLSKPNVLDSAGIVRELERASTRLVELLRSLDRASTRDEAIDILLGFLNDSHERAAFLAIKGGHLTPFVQRPASAQTPPQLALDAASTFQDVIGTRLPYRGTLADEAARVFLRAAFGVDPDEVLILPIAVKDRVVALLYGDGRKHHTFDEHFAIAGRAAGLALERILQTRRGSTSS